MDKAAEHSISPRVTRFFAAHARWLWAAAAIAVLALGGAVWRARVLAGERAQTEAALRKAEVSRGDVLAAVSASGPLVPAADGDLYFTATGTVAQVLVQPGDGVRAGDPLAVLDDTDLRFAVRQAEAALEIQRLTLESLKRGPRPEDLQAARANWLSAQAALADLKNGTGTQDADIARLDYQRAQEASQKAYEQLYNLENAKLPNGVPIQVPEETIQLARLQAETAGNNAEIARLTYEQARVQATQADLSVAYQRIAYYQAVMDQLQAGPSPHAVAQAEAALSAAQVALDVARYQLDQATLRAPFDGVVGEVNVKVGQAPGMEPAVRLVDDSAFHLDVAVDEADIARVTLGQPVTIKLDALPEAKLTGTVDRLGPAASNVEGIITFPIRIALDPVERQAAPLRPGMTATADIVVAEARDVVVVPNWALRRDRQTGQVLLSLYRDGQVVEVPAKVGLRDEQVTQILEGAVEGDVVAVRTGGVGSETE